ncbi:MAG: SGNH/GDSL hydrolase family protein [Lachnospiraceae bacterium]|nr:SGNH/GDSL hydrolase family protein [Lachnospiraceae bacterium]
MSTQAKGKKKVKPAKIITIVAVIVVVLTITQLVILGAKGGIGPLKFLKNNRMAKLPGNAEQYHPENLTALEDSPLQGRRFLFLGSSVTNGSAALEVSVADYIRILDGCEVVKEAQNGTTLADNGGSSYLSRLKKVDTNQHFDAVIVQLSTNDAKQKVALGEVSDSREPDAFDTSTVVGSMEAIIAYAAETWDCPVIFYTGTKFESAEYQAMAETMPLLQEKWGIGVIDLWNNAEMNAVSEEDYAFYMSDEIHPTQAGYLLWWTPVFQEYLYDVME